MIIQPNSNSCGHYVINNNLLKMENLVKSNKIIIN